MTSVVCKKCGKRGSLTRKRTKSGRYMYEYWYVEHYNPLTSKRSWCYVGKIGKVLQLYPLYREQIKQIEA